MTVKTHRFEIVGWSDKEARSRWMEISDQCREMVNVIWQQWEAWHVANGSDQKVMAFADELRKFRRNEIPTKPKLEVECMPSELSKRIYAKLTKRFPTVHARTRVLLQQLTLKRMTGKDVEGKWNIWIAVLLNRQGRPNATHHQPIPFDKASCKPFELVGEKYTNYELAIKLTRLPSDKKNSPSIEDKVQLKARKGGAVIMRRICAGDYKFCGSSIMFNASNRKWFALIAYDDKVDGTDKEVGAHTATLIPARDRPWILWKGTRYEHFGGSGGYVAGARKRLLTNRWSRQENYKYAGSSNKGRGRQRAMAGVQRLSEAWKHFCKSANHATTKQIVDYCVANGVGHLIYLQPAEGKGDSRFLVKAGKTERHDSTGWDWAQVATMLSYKCKDHGIHLEVRKCGATGRKIPGNNAVSSVPGNRRGNRRSGKARRSVLQGV